MTITSTLQSIINSLFNAEANNDTQRQFVPIKSLCEKDSIIISMLNSPGHARVAFCICDPSLPDIPIIFASDGFCHLTGYSFAEIEGKNCRFLQGSNTSQDDVGRIRSAIREEKEMHCNLLNYKKDGTEFFNEFFLCPLRGSNTDLQYFIGVQCCVDHLGPGQMASNPGWVYTQGNHA